MDIFGGKKSVMKKISGIQMEQFRCMNISIISTKQRRQYQIFLRNNFNKNKNF